MKCTRQYVYLWAFRVRPGCRRRFLKAYGRGGDWERLFCKARGYIRTELLQDRKQRDRFVTVDYWRDRASHLAFQRCYAREFEALDRRCASLTSSERLLGQFELRYRP
jgi:heme-degrading monooxygenase HmoA